MFCHDRPAELSALFGGWVSEVLAVSLAIEADDLLRLDAQARQLCYLSHNYN